jgi:hypothetical protein
MQCVDSLYVFPITINSLQVPFDMPIYSLHRLKLICPESILHPWLYFLRRESGTGERVIFGDVSDEPLAPKVTIDVCVDNY